EKGEKIEGAEIKPGRNRATLVSSDLKDLHAKLGPVLGGESIEQFAMAVVDNPKPTAVRQHIANKLGIPETKVIEQLGKALGADSPLVNKPERKSVEVTADLADIIQKVSKEISERHREGAIEAAREASVSGADSLPAAAATAKPVARRRAKKAEPEAPVAPAEIPVEPIAEDASEAVGQVQVGTKFM
ncbi:MAG TPA: hypothetical protein VFT61_06555, partial [Sphingomicrobium sp.]|nr:hypothetical protein [Sphingomicrobium sp.]